MDKAKRPELPPNARWSELCETENLARPHWRVEMKNAYGQWEEIHRIGATLEEDNPHSAADFAWECWKTLTGLKRPMSISQQYQWVKEWCEKQGVSQEETLVRGLLDALKDGSRHLDVSRYEHTVQWYGVRWKRLQELLKEGDTDLHVQVCNIMANGTVGCWEPPTYAQQINQLRHEKNKYEGISQKLTDWLKEMRDAGNEFRKEDSSSFMLWGDLADEIDELMDWKSAEKE